MKKHLLFGFSLIISIFCNYIIASQIEVSPTKVFFSPDQKFTYITVKNLSHERVFVQAELLDWQQKDGKNNYMPSYNLLINPLIFGIESNKEQIVRIGRRSTDNNLNQEISYRLLLSEIPDQFKDKQGLKVLLRLSLPIFINPTTKTEHDIKWSKNIIDNKTVTISMYNPNNFHKMINKIELKDKLNKKLYEKQNSFIYLLPKQKYTWTIENNPKLVEHIKDIQNDTDNKLALTLDTENGFTDAIAVNEQNIEQQIKSNIMLTQSENNKENPKNKG